jgi:hypothetical protein
LAPAIEQHRDLCKSVTVTAFQLDYGGQRKNSNAISSLFSTLTGGGSDLPMDLVSSLLQGCF